MADLPEELGTSGPTTGLPELVVPPPLPPLSEDLEQRAGVVRDWLVEAERQVVVVETIPDACRLRAGADAVRQWARTYHLGLDLQNRAALLKLRTEQRIGALLRGMHLWGGDRRSPARSRRPNLRQTGLRRDESSRCQALLDVEEFLLQRYLAEVRDRRRELTSRGLLAFARRQALAIARAGETDPVRREEELRDPCRALAVAVERIARACRGDERVAFVRALYDLADRYAETFGITQEPGR